MLTFVSEVISKLFAVLSLAVLVACSFAMPTATTSAEETNWYDDYILFPYYPGCAWRVAYSLDYSVDNVLQDTYSDYAYFDDWNMAVMFAVSGLGNGYGEIDAWDSIPPQYKTDSYTKYFYYILDEGYIDIAYAAEPPFDDGNYPPNSILCSEGSYSGVLTKGMTSYLGVDNTPVDWSEVENWVDSGIYDQYAHNDEFSLYREIYVTSYSGWIYHSASEYHYVCISSLGQIESI